MAEKISKNKVLLSLLGDHEIGYHSSSHSVRPIIPEFTDVNSYELAVDISLKREQFHINPITGMIEGEGGIKIMREIFNDHDIDFFKAPGCCWTPPYLEAMVKLGIKFDFSSTLAHDKPLFFRGITFYPSPLQLDCTPIKGLPRALHLISQRENTSLNAHPDFYVNSKPWDSIFWNGNPEKIIGATPRTKVSTWVNFSKLEVIFAFLAILKRRGKIEVTPNLEEADEELNNEKVNVTKVYESSISWCRVYFKYEPNFLYSHFKDYFR